MKIGIPDAFANPISNWLSETKGEIHRFTTMPICRLSITGLFSVIGSIAYYKIRRYHQAHTTKPCMKKIPNHSR
eukprot:scaffold48478_cov29-Attheya_sp.AAC.1